MKNFKYPDSVIVLIFMASMKNLIVLTAFLLALQFVSAACDSNTDCDNNQFCSDSVCVYLDCGECAVTSFHGCTPKKGGVCCDGFWNSKFSACEISYSFVETNVSRMNNERASHLFEEGVDAVEIGWIERARYLFEGAELAVSVAQSKDDFNEEVHELIDQKFEQAEADIDNNRFIESKRVFSKINQIQKTMRKPVVESSSTQTGSTSPPPTIAPREKPETPWFFIIILVIMLIVLFVALIVFMKNKEKGRKKELVESLEVNTVREEVEGDKTTKWFD